MTDQQINEAVARKLGYPIIDGGSNSAAICTDFDKGVPVTPIPAYSTSIEAAWEIVEEMSGKGDYIEVYADKSRGVYICQNRSKRISTQADTAPRAICEAFLKLP